MNQQKYFPQFADQNILQIDHSANSPLKFPTINPRSRNQVRSKNETRASPALPVISNPIQEELPFQRKKSRKTENNDEDKGDFSMQIEERLRLVLQNVGQEENGSDLGDSDVDFETLVNQNKEMLKLQKQKHSVNKIDGGVTEKSDQRIKHKSKTIKDTKSNKLMDNILEKRMKQYKELSSENKYLQKKKELMAQRSETLEKNKIGFRQREDSSKQIKLFVAQKISEKKSLDEIKEIQNKKNGQQNSKNCNLFDNIHQLLQNPHKMRREEINTKGASSSKVKELQNKLRSINQKLGVENFDTKQTEHCQAYEHQTVRDWKMIEAKKGTLHCLESTFEKEIQKVSDWQEKNSASLQKYLEHQKTLVELALIKKIPSKGQNRSN